MKNRFSTLCVSLVGFLLLFAWPSGAAQPLVISAAASLEPALKEIGNAFEKKTGSRLAFTFGASGMLERQIENGAPVDVFISASEKQIDGLQRKGSLLPNSRKVLLRNSLVLVVPKGKSGISSFDDLMTPSVKRIAVGEPRTVPAGEYAAQVFEKLGLAKALSPKLVLAENVRQVLTYVETGNVDAGVVYLTDALGSAKVSIAAKADPSSHNPILYPVAVLKSTKNAVAAKNFESFLFGQPASQIFRKHGFLLGPG